MTFARINNVELNSEAEADTFISNFTSGKFREIFPEAEILTNSKIKNTRDMINAANKLLKFGVKNVLLKGGHSNSKFINDVLVNNNEIKNYFNIVILI